MVASMMKRMAVAVRPLQHPGELLAAIVQDAVHDKVLNTGRVLKHDPAKPAAALPAGASPPDAARSAPQEARERGRQLERLSSSHGNSLAQAERQADTKHQISGEHDSSALKHVSDV